MDWAKTPFCIAHCHGRLGTSAKARRAPEKVYGRRKLHYASRKARARHTGADAANGERGERHETQGRLRTALPFPAAHARHHDAEHPLHARLRPRETGPHRHRPVGADLRLSGRFRKLVQPDSRPGRGDAHLDRHGHQRHRAARSVRRRMRRRSRSRSFRRRPSYSSWPAATATAIGLLDVAWTHFGHTQPGWARVQAICDFVHAAHRLRLRARAA